MTSLIDKLERSAFNNSNDVVKCVKCLNEGPVYAFLDDDIL